MDDRGGGVGVYRGGVCGVEGGSGGAGWGGLRVELEVDGRGGVGGGLMSGWIPRGLSSSIVFLAMLFPRIVPLNLDVCVYSLQCGSI